MSLSRSALRVAAAVGTTTALTLAGAGAANATTSKSNIEGNTVSVTFKLESNQLISDTCGAALVPPTAGAELLKNANGTGGIGGILDSIDALDGVTVLKKGSASFVAMTLATPTDTVTATNVPSGVYGLVTVCGSDFSNPGIDVVTVGSPFDIISGLSSGGGLDTFSSALGGGDENTGALGLGTLSSALDGGALAGAE